MPSDNHGIATAFDRAGLLRRGALAVAAGTAVAALPRGAAAASVPDADLAYLRLVTAAELLKADFQQRALKSKKLGARAAGVVRRVQSDDAAHYAGLVVLMSGAGQQPTTAGDIDFTYPAGTFASERAILAFADNLGQLTLGAYLGALENVQTGALRLPFGQIAANEAQQLSALAPLLGRPTIGRAFAGAMSIDNVSSALDRYES